MVCLVEIEMENTRLVVIEPDNGVIMDGHMGSSAGRSRDIGSDFGVHIPP
jgi:hypothetical protein